jgi:adenylate cyclase
MDVAGYTRLTETDVEGTHGRLIAIMNCIVAPALAETGGRMVKRTGDGALIEFASVTLAVRAAMQIQRATDAQENGRPTEQRIRLRIGINLGDIIVERSHDDIYGDGVNIAARLEGLARPGDIILSDAAVQTVDRTGYKFVDLGLQRLKNIARPVRAYRLIPAGDPDTEDQIAALAAPAPIRGERFQDRPAIAVLPFKITGTAAEHIHFADDLTESLIGAIGRWRSFPVAARNSVFAYRGRDVDLKSVAMQLGVRFAVEGSLRWSGPRRRAQVQFMDVETMDHLLDEQFEQDAADPSQALDDLVLSISGALEPQILRYERERAPALPPELATPYECLARGLWHHFRFTPEDNQQARAYFRRVLELDPTHAQASAALAVALNYPAVAGWVKDRRATYDEAIVHARNAVRFDPRDPHAHFSLGLIHQNTGAPHEAIAQFREAIRLHPSHIPSLANLGLTCSFIDRADLGLPYCERAVQIGAYDSRLFVWQACLAVTYYLAGRYRDALAACQRALTAKPDYPVAIRYLVASLGQLGRRAEAPGVIRLLTRLDGDLAATEAYMRNMFVESAVRRIVEGLRKAGFA